MATTTHTSVPAQREHPTSRLLRDHVPLTLLLDLADPSGPPSSAVYVAEGGRLDWPEVLCGDLVWDDDPAWDVCWDASWDDAVPARLA